MHVRQRQVIDSMGSATTSKADVVNYTPKFKVQVLLPTDSQPNGSG